MTLINPGVVSDMLNSFITLAYENGKEYFDRWEFLNAYRSCMVGNPAISVLADAYVKGIRDYDTDKAYRLAVSTTERCDNGDRGYSIVSKNKNSGYSGIAIEEYVISNTLEFSYNEWCLSMLDGMARHKEYSFKYGRRSQSYRNIFDSEKSWSRPRREDGSWERWPEEGRLKQWYETAECNPYQQGWFVPHDIPGMIELMGGKGKVIKDMTVFFEKVP